MAEIIALALALLLTLTTIGWHLHVKALQRQLDAFTQEIMHLRMELADPPNAVVLHFPRGHR